MERGREAVDLVALSRENCSLTEAFDLRHSERGVRRSMIPLVLLSWAYIPAVWVSVASVHLAGVCLVVRPCAISRHKRG